MAQDGQPDSPPDTPGSRPTITTSPTSDRSSTSAAETVSDSKGDVAKRVMEKTSDKLGRNMPLLSQSQPSLPQSSHRRILSLSRGKGKERQAQEEHESTSRSQQLDTSPSSPPLPSRKQHRVQGATGDDESPFITPTSPSLDPTRPENLIFRGFRSVRVFN
ncbi:hypothetical protein BD310DRAFT_284297 [Dichomitus squalens]|uniref:Uncharacterized protein n=1 Tax=Dichomitus squalens TaxID=114155 RepID=A0A4Q9QAZ0_9APHY|nr:hypothetical protein BD310DRAFT_284297 [Dichomitus squalens]